MVPNDDDDSLSALGIRFNKRGQLVIVDRDLQRRLLRWLGEEPNPEDPPLKSCPDKICPMPKPGNITCPNVYCPSSPDPWDTGNPQRAREIEPGRGL